MSSPYPWFAGFAFFLLINGFAVRKSNRGLHVGLMSGGMGLDLIIVLILEFGRDAVGTAMGSALTLFQQVHVASSTLAVALYIPVFILGMIRWRKPSFQNLKLRTWHMRLGYLALACRSIGFFFMFSMIGRNA